MKSRKEVAEYINTRRSECCDRNVKSAWHYGLVELRELMDFIFECKPKDKSELIETLSR